MNQKPRFHAVGLTCLLIATAGFLCPLAVQADDSTTTTPPAATNTAGAASVETTNAVASAPATETTNTPPTSAEPATTNSPAAVESSATTNMPAPVAEAVITNAPAVTNPPAATNNMPAGAVAPAPAAAPASAETPAAAKPAAAAPLVRSNQPRTFGEEEPSYRPFTLGIDGGSTGVGGEASWRFADHFGVRAGVDYFQYSFSTKVQDAKYNLKIHLMSEPVALDLYPSKNSTFHLSLGALINQNKFTGANGSAENITINGNPYSIPANALSLTLKQPAALPYASVGGSIYLGSEHHWSLGGELGAAYGRWNASFNDSSGTVTPTDLAAEKNKVQNGANKVPVWPIIKINVSYSF